MIGYVTLGTNDLPRSAAFYDALLAEIGAKHGYEPSPIEKAVADGLPYHGDNPADDLTGDLTALLGSRICHDLISPIGAIGNGLAAAIGIALAMIVLALAYPNLPSLETLTDYRPKIPLRVYTADGYLIGEYGEERRAGQRILG